MAQVAADLTSMSVGHCLVGGFAITVRCEPRFTRDLDFAVAVADDGEAEALVRALHGIGYTTYSTVEQAQTGRLATARMWLFREESRVAVDLLFASSGIESEVCSHASDVEVLPGLVIPVAQAGHLTALKLLSVDDERPRDAQDLIGLRQVVTAADIVLAQQAVRLIEQRQANRGRDLVSALNRWLQKRP